MVTVIVFLSCFPSHHYLENGENNAIGWQTEPQTPIYYSITLAPLDDQILSSPWISRVTHEFGYNFDMYALEEIVADLETFRRAVSERRAYRPLYIMIKLVLD